MVVGFCGSVTKLPTIQPIKPAFLQFFPPSTLLNAPTLVPAYTVLGSWRSTVRKLTIPPSGPTFVHSLVPAQTVLEAIPRIRTTVEIAAVGSSLIVLTCLIGLIPRILFYTNVNVRSIEREGFR